MTTREELHRLVDELPERDLPLAQRLLYGLHFDEDDPLLRALLLAPWDDEPESPAEAEFVRKAREARAAGAVTTHAEARRRKRAESGRALTRPSRLDAEVDDLSLEERWQRSAVGAKSTCTGRQ